MSNIDNFINAMHSRLAAVEGKLGLPTPTMPVTNPSSSGSAPSSSAVVTSYSAFVNEKVLPFVATSKKIGGKVEKLGDAMNDAFAKLGDILVFASENKKPSGTEFMSNLNAAVSAVQGLRERDAFENHAKACSEGVPALGWVNPSNMTPAPFIIDMADASVFYANKVRSEFKAKEGGDAHVQWCKELDAVFRGLAAFVKENQPTGVTWNPKGKDGGGAVPAAAPPTSSAAAGASTAAATGSAAVNLFAELSKIDQSSGKTAGLKHVTKDMKAKNNAEPPVEKKAPVAATKKEQTAAPKVQVFALQGNKWVVEGQTSQISITSDQVSVKHSVYIYNCVGATIVIDGKCNTITIDGCKKTQVVFQDVLALCEVVNSKDVKVQCKGKAPTISIDKTDGIVIYLSRDTMYESKIVASKSSEMNVQFPGATDDDAWIEKVIPEQYVHHVQKDNTVSAEVSELYSHGG